MKRAAAGHRIKRWLYLIHRWVGIVTCLLFAIWFVSGLVMVYVPYPALTDEEAKAGLPAIDWSGVAVGPGEAARHAGLAAPRGAVLEMQGANPVWRVEGDAVLSAIDGRLIGPIEAHGAGEIAARFGKAPAGSIEHVERDQWTVSGGYDGDRPLWKVRLAGEAGRDIYVSSRSGAVVLDTDRRERFWNWLGSIPHWIYPTVLRQNQPAWRQTVLWVSGPCILAAITGMWIGLLRVRLGRHRFQGGRATPYRGWMFFHHVAGLAGGVMLTAWIFSGWLSVDPGRLFASPGIASEARTAFDGTRALPELDPVRLAAKASGAVRVEASWIAGRPLLIVDRAEGKREVLDMVSLSPFRPDEAQLVATSVKLVPGARIASVERLRVPDAYWYAVGTLPRLPVLRMRFDDDAGTWVHLDPETGAVQGSMDRRRRIYRWAFDLLHKWDLNGLTLNRPLWDGLLWLFSLLGLATSITGIRIGWTRLRRRPPRPRASRA